MFQDDLSRCRYPCRLIVGTGIALFALLSHHREGYSQSDDQTSNPLLETYVNKRIREHPEDASAWRILGRIRVQQKRLAEARRAFERSVKLEPASAAAQFDLGRLLADHGNEDAARNYLKRTVLLAPESDYASDARKLLERISYADTGMQQVDYKIRSFDGTKTVESLLRQKTERERRSRTIAPFGFRLEAGALYNSNVALAPLSRQLSPEQPASAQAYLNPELQWVFLDRKRWRVGTTLRGQFTLNEGSFRQFNLQSYQPGAFVESFHAVGTVVVLPRLAYEFTHDEFDATTFGNRHAVTPSLWISWNERESTLLFWTVDHSNFQDDGIAPSIMSQDGWTNVVGLSHDHLVGSRFLKLLRGGIDYTNAATRGSDFRFDGVHLFAELMFALGWDTELKLRGGWGFRNYPDFEFTPTRNENIWRCGVELQKSFNNHLSAAMVFNYVWFDSKNPLFEAERFIAGIVTTIEY